MRIVLMASGDFAIPTLRALAGSDHQVCCVVTQPDRASGRGRKQTPTPVKRAALELGLEVFATEDINGAESVARLSACNADLGLAIAFGQKIGPAVCGLFTHNCVNLHASQLPAYRGAAPFQWAVINGERETGVTVFQLADRMDAGPIYVTCATDIKPLERACELHDRLAEIGVGAVTQTLELLERDRPFVPIEQDGALASRAPKLSKRDGYIRFDVPATVLAARVRGLWDWPGAKCEFVSAAAGRRERVTLAQARACEVADGSDAGTASPGALDTSLHAATTSGVLEILEIQPEGKRVMTFADFVNGRNVMPGDRFESIAAD